MASLRFTGPLQPGLVAGLVLIAVVLVVAVYWRESRSLAGPLRYALPVIRATAVGILLATLAAPVWHRRTVVGTPGRVVFALDTSESMSMSDTSTSGSPSRLDRAARLIWGSENASGWTETLSGSHVVDVVTFSDSANLTWSNQAQGSSRRPTDLDVDGQTDLSIALSSVAESSVQPARQPMAFVLLSDGRHNMGPSPVDVARRLKLSGAHVHAIGMGSQEPPVDAAVVRVTRPASVATNGQLLGSVTVQQSGLEGETLTLEVELGGQLVWRESFVASSNAPATVPFELDVEELVQRLGHASAVDFQQSTLILDMSARVLTASGDAIAANDSMPFRIGVSTRSRRLLILDGSSRWEMRYLRNLFERDPTWSVETILFGVGTDQNSVRRGHLEGQFPDSREAISKFDAIVLGEIPAEQLTEFDVDLIREFVVRGGGLVMVDGHYGELSRLTESMLSDVIPVRHLDQTMTDVQSLRLTRSGVERSELNLWSGSEQVRDNWRRLPPPTSVAAVETRSGAEVLGNAVDENGVEYPWLVTRTFGSGRVAYLSSDQTWRWRYKVADRFHAKFWSQLVESMIQPPYSVDDEFVAIGTDRIEYGRGDRATIRVRLQDVDGRPVNTATVDALLIADDQTITTVSLDVDDASRGTYRGTTEPLENGAYRIRVRASGFDADALSVTTPIWVSDEDAVELHNTSLDAQSMKQIATAGGGLYLHESSASDILPDLELLSSGNIVETDWLIWQSFPWFFSVIGLLGVEWWLRKRAGLP